MLDTLELKGKGYPIKQKLVGRKDGLGVGENVSIIRK